MKELITVYALYLFESNPVFQRHPWLWKMLLLLHKSCCYVFTPRYDKCVRIQLLVKEWMWGGVKFGMGCGGWGVENVVTMSNLNPNHLELL